MGTVATQRWLELDSARTNSGSTLPNSVTFSHLLNLYNSVPFNSLDVYAGH